MSKKSSPAKTNKSSYDLPAMNHNSNQMQQTLKQSTQRFSRLNSQLSKVNDKYVMNLLKAKHKKEMNWKEWKEFLLLFAAQWNQFICGLWLGPSPLAASAFHFISLTKKFHSSLLALIPPSLKKRRADRHFHYYLRVEWKRIKRK